MEGLIKYAEKAFEIPSIAIMAMLAFLAVLKMAKRYFDSKVEERSSRVRFIVEEMKNLDMSNAYLVEQVFSERYKVLLNYKEILYFLRTSRPSLNLYLYQSTSVYFLFNNTGFKLSLDSKRTPDYLRRKGLLLGFGYYVFSVPAMIFAQAMPELYIKNISGFVLFYFVIIFLSFLAVMCVHAQLKTENARKLISSIEHDNS
ncbi:hypothetical protein [Neptuniibacter sp. QD34_54]|uniref:hypothetical protein n=1 Tax=Neptuniibacter sp. QD34_54 TaxID=3398208 RepID=UPI0039F55180